MDIASIGPARDPLSPVPAPRDNEATEAVERDRDPAPLPPDSGTMIDTSA